MFLQGALDTLTKFFWIDLKVFVVKSLNHSYQVGMLSVSQILGIITLIPKGDKNKMFLKNLGLAELGNTKLC